MINKSCIVIELGKNLYDFCKDGASLYDSAVLFFYIWGIKISKNSLEMELYNCATDCCTIWLREDIRIATKINREVKYGILGNFSCGNSEPNFY